MTRERAVQGRMAVLADVGLTGLLAALLLTTSVSAVTASELAGPWRATVVIALIALHATVLVRSRWPVAAFAAGSAAMLLLALVPDLTGPAASEVGGPYSALLLPSGLVFFVLLYTVSSSTRPRLPQVSLAVALLGGAITVLRLWNADAYITFPASGTMAWRLFITAAVAAGVLAAWSLGRYRATRLAWVSALEERAVRAEQQRLATIEQARLDLEREAERAGAAERRRIAREMHDVVAHSLAVVVGQAEGGRMVAAHDGARTTQVLETIADQGRQALAEMRSLLGVLREDDSSGRTPQPGLADLDRIVDDVRRTGTRVELLENGARARLPPTVDLAAFRFVQEALTNVVKHASPGARAEVTFDWGPHDLRIRVHDDGRDDRHDHGRDDDGDGGGPAGASGGGLEGITGRGLLGMRERLALVGGDLGHAGPDPSGDGGFLVEARIPVPHSRPPAAPGVQP